MSFSELLRKARNNETIEDIKTTVEEIENVVVEKEPFFMELGEAIVRTSVFAVKSYKKLNKGTGASLRIAKNLASGHLKQSQFEKAWQIQDRFNNKRADWHLVGGKPMQLLKKAVVEDNIPLEKALTLKIEIKEK